MAGKGETDNMQVEELKELIRQHELRQPTEEERRAVRNFHSEIRDELIAHREDITTENLQNVLERLEENFPRVQTPREAVKDAENIRLLSEMQRQKIQQYDLSLVPFMPGEFAENVKKYCVETLNSQPERGQLSSKSWTLLGKNSQQFFKKSPGLHFMFGAFEHGEVVKKLVAREKRLKDCEVGRVTQLRQLDSFKETAKNEATTKEVEEILKTLWFLYEKNNRSPICYFEFVVNPFSFGQTVENIFYVSFLAKDGFISLQLDEDELPVLVPLEGADKDAHKEKTRHQIVISITPGKWKEIIKTFKITQPLIKNRTSKKQPSRNTEQENEAVPSTSTARPR